MSLILESPELQHGFNKEKGFDEEKYKFLSKYATFMQPPSRPVLGREQEMRRLLASLNRVEVSNAFLLGDAGSGKTMLVQGTLERDTDRIYVEVDLPKMASSDNGEDGATQMASRIKGLFDDAEKFKREVEQENGIIGAGELSCDQSSELVLFMDEFHLLVQLSPAAAQAIKPALAESGRRGIKVIAATTFAEFHEYIEKDQALMQRLQRINIREPNKETVVAILKSIAKAHKVADMIYDEHLYDLIYELSNRYVPADSQPRKSILMLDSMIGWMRTFPGEYKMDRKLLSDVIHDSTGVQVSFKADGRTIEKQLNQRVLSQQFAMRTLESRLQIAVADLHDKTRPISSFLFTGPTGVGKTETAKALSTILFGDERAMIRFDMSEYAMESSLNYFREELTDRVWNRSHSIVLLDEIEKAHRSITRLLLQVLDDGRLSNAQGREVSFLNTYIILTTNAGNEVYKGIAHYATSDDGSDGMKEYWKVIRQSLMKHPSFAPELINRMNAIIPFHPLSAQTYENILIKKLENLADVVYRTHGVDLQFHPNVVKYLVHDSFDIDTNSGGARGLVSLLETHVVAELSRYINKYPDAKHIGVYVEGEMAFENKSMLKSSAVIKVGTIDIKKMRRS
ncbi:AAA family ATPase [Paenibacillus sp. Y412MC10]|uniref:AAA family ATPase n=1 Tax=Geobacillus sp. (strain Y412MC10) TaxID=481743 RepID=UPI0011AA9150|nr:AAA family ATPase [Paenibacillus sp. Y412MC10]